MGLRLLSLLLLTACTTSKPEPVTILCYSYTPPAIIAWGGTEQEAEENMQMVNCDLKPGADCSNRLCDKFEVL